MRSFGYARLFFYDIDIHIDIFQPQTSHPIVSKLDNDFHKYHVATLRYGLHGSAISIIVLGVGSSANRYVRFIAFLNPKSVTGNMSFRARQNIKNMSAVFLYLLLLLAGLLFLHLPSLGGRSSLICHQQCEMQDP